MYIFLASVFCLFIIAGIFVFSLFLVGHASRKLILKYYLTSLCIYGLLIVLGTGPSKSDRAQIEPSKSLYKLPWKSGVSRLVSQGNRSFTSHRGKHLYAWDFWMPIGTEILSSRAGKVFEVEQSFNGIGLNSNYIKIEHDDGSVGLYAHIKNKGSLVKTGQKVLQGQPLALSGMVGQTINPHLHFVVLKANEKYSIPIVFSDVKKGVPFAGFFYESGNQISLE